MGLAFADTLIAETGATVALVDRYDRPGGHWTVAYGFDGEHIYLTNYGRMTWDDFRRAWMSFVPRLIDMHGKGLVAVS